MVDMLGSQSLCCSCHAHKSTFNHDVSFQGLCTGGHFQTGWRLFKTYSEAQHLLGYSTYQTVITSAFKVGTDLPADSLWNLCQAPFQYCDRFYHPLIKRKLRGNHLHCMCCL